MVATTPAKRVNQDNTKPSMNWEQTRDAPTNTTQAAVRPTIKAYLVFHSNTSDGQTKTTEARGPTTTKLNTARKIPEYEPSKNIISGNFIRNCKLAFVRVVQMPHRVPRHRGAFCIHYSLETPRQ